VCGFTQNSSLCTPFYDVGSRGAAATEGVPFLLVEQAVRARQDAHLPLPGLAHPRMLPGKADTV